MNIDLNNKSHCYILGYFWADCHFNNNYENKNNRRYFSFEILLDDFYIIWPILEDIGFNKFSTRKRKNSKNIQATIKKAEFTFLQFLADYQFDKKMENCKLYYSLTDEMKVFFIKGFMDGDGSISFDKNNLFRISFNGPKEQNWDFMKNFLEKNGISYKIYRKERKAHDISHKKLIHSYSVLEIIKLDDKVKFCKLLENLDVGLRRKISIYNKFKEFRLTYQSEYSGKKRPKILSF